MGRGWFAVALYVIMLLLAILAASPAPVATPLKTITHIHVTAFCAALRDTVGPAVLPLLRNKAVIGKGQSLFLEMAQAATLYGQSPRMMIDLDMQRLSNVVGELVKNTEATDAALQAFDREQVKDDDGRLRAIRHNLETVLAKQREMLNIFSGTYASYTSNELNYETVKHFDPVSAVAAVNTQTEFSTVRPPHQPSVKPSTSPKQSTGMTLPSEVIPIKRLDLGFAGQTPFATLFNSIVTREVEESSAESVASQQILSAAQSCRSL